MGAEMYDLLKKMHDVGGKQYWPCDSCSSTMTKVNTRLISLEKKMDSIEGEVAKQGKTIENNATDITNIRKEMEDVKKNAGKDKANTEEVLRELKEREAIVDNIIIHNLDEPANNVKSGLERKKKETTSYYRIK